MKDYILLFQEVVVVEFDLQTFSHIHTCEPQQSAHGAHSTCFMNKNGSPSKIDTKKGAP